MTDNGRSLTHTISSLGEMFDVDRATKARIYPNISRIPLG
jgi:hypothetical protein